METIILHKKVFHIKRKKNTERNLVKSKQCAMLIKNRVQLEQMMVQHPHILKVVFSNLPPKKIAEKSREIETVGNVVKIS